MGRLIYLQIYQDIFLDDQVFNRLDSQYSLLAPRGKILDRNGNVLALDIKGYSVGIDLEKFKFEKKKGKDPNVAILNHESAVRRNACCRFKRFSWSKLDKKNNVPNIIVTIEAPKKDESISE